MNDNSRLREWWPASLDVVSRASGWFLVLGILLITLGALALAASVLTTLGTMVFFGCLLMVGGVFQLIHAKARGWDGLFLLLLTGLLGVVTGGLMVPIPASRRFPSRCCSRRSSWWAACSARWALCCCAFRTGAGRV
jgi:uncharacterized membrane protein HdeD (DUF308 family)